jgi:hypothetical protein
MTPQKVNNHTTKDLKDSEGDKISISELKRMMIIVMNEMKEDMYKNSMKFKQNTITKLIKCKFKEAMK